MMASLRSARHYGFSLLVASCLVTVATVPALAQESAQSGDPNTGSVTLTASTDVLNTYMFRGIRQDDTGLIAWPAADIAISLFSGNGGLKSLGLNVGTWNSLHTGDTGSNRPVDPKLWYESDFYATLAFGFGGGVSLGTTYTAYTSPNSGFGNVKEISFKLGVDDSKPLGRASLKPYGIIAFELDGQADAGTNEGTYLELGVAPGIGGKMASLAFPTKLGLGLKDYYETPGGGPDTRFGYFSIAGIVTVPISGIPSRFGGWNVHGGVEFQALGDATKVFNGGDASKVIGSFGIGLSY
jgi:hypothetical protein